MSSKADKEHEGKQMSILECMGVLVASLPVVGYVGYAVAYLRESGFCDQFGIPREFISIDWTNILVTAGTILGFLFLGIGPVILLSVLLRQCVSQRPSMKPVASILLCLTGLLTTTLYYHFYYPRLWLLWLIGLSVLLGLLVLLDLLIPWVSKGKNETYLHKYEEQNRQLYVLGKACPPLFVLVALFLVLCVSVSLAMTNGRETAKSQSQFLVPSTHPQTVVLRIYGENLVCATFNEESHQIRRNYFILKLDDDPRPELAPRNVGPLTVSDNVS